MQGLFRRLGTRLGVSVGLILIVSAVIVIGRVFGGTESPPRSYTGPDAMPTVSSTAGDDGQVGPTPTAFADDAEVRSAASTFLASWLQRDASPEAWHSALVPLTTTSLAESLVGVDPIAVPATRVVGSPQVTIQSDLYAQVSVPVDTGVVVLGLLHRGERWLVDSIDWERT
jgi:hypothetical protein